MPEALKPQETESRQLVDDTDVSIRPATAEEIDHMKQVTRREVFLWVPDSEYFVAVRADGRVVGFCALTVKNSKAKLRNEFVFPLARSQGIGGAMIDHLLEAAKARGCKTVEAVCTPASVRLHLERGASQVSTSSKSGVPLVHVKFNL
jgi:N-acetylglutamate synthase-like GNAT family acetyltransferase